MGLFSRTVPEIGHVSCSKRLDELETRFEQLEDRLAENRLVILDTVEKVAERLDARTRMRAKRQEEPQENPAEVLARARARYGGNSG